MTRGFSNTITVKKSNSRGSSRGGQSRALGRRLLSLLLQLEGQGRSEAIDVPEPIVAVRRATGQGCPRCQGFLYRNVIPFSGNLQASHCANCGWQGEYAGEVLEECAPSHAGARRFDFDAARETIRAARRKAGIVRERLKKEKLKAKRRAEWKRAKVTGALSDLR